MEPLTIASEHFECLADAMAGALLNVGMIPGHQYDAVSGMLVRCLRFQAALHEGWEDGDEEAHRRILMDGR